MKEVGGAIGYADQDHTQSQEGRKGNPNGRIAFDNGIALDVGNNNRGQKSEGDGSDKEINP